MIWSNDGMVPLLLTGISFNASMDKYFYIHFKPWDEITYPFPNFNGANCWSVGMDK